ncbi:carboxypeptidase regulatory-like domain-containing protein [Candidatus Sumerlaeota bacterium]|nr:carboxypeptidase regulatory-like domain-containing protein [Candidatus Sumerlaeota bacterium]
MTPSATEGEAQPPLEEAEGSPDAIAIPLQETPQAQSSVSGIIRDAEGEPVPGLEIRLLPHIAVLTADLPQREGLWDIAPAHTTTTDDEGLLRIDEVEPGRWWMALMLSESEMFLVGAPISVDWGMDYEGLALTVPRTTSLTGRAVAHDGSPLPGGLIHFAAQHASGWWIVRSSATDTGEFTLSALERPLDSHLHVSAPGHGPVRLRRWETAALRGGVLTDVLLPEGAGIEGFVHGPSGAPVEGVHIWATIPSEMEGGESLHTGVVAQSDARGIFTLRDLPPGPIDLHATVRGLRLDDPFPTFTLPGEVLAGTVLDLRATQAIQGRVLDAAGRPVADALVQLMPDSPMPFRGPFNWFARIPIPLAQPDQWTLTDDTGTFTVEGLRRGESRSVVVRASAAPVTLFRDLTPSTHRTLQVPRGASVTGEVVSKVTDTGLLGAEVRAIHELSGSEGDTFTVSGGTFQTHFLPEGEHRLYAVAPGHAGTTLRGIDLEDRAIVSGIRIRLGQGVAFAGHVLNRRTREPVIGGEVRLRGGDATLNAFTDQTGFFRVEHVGEGVWDLFAEAPLYLSAVRTALTVSGSDILGHTIYLEPAARIQGRVFDTAGRTIGGATVGVRYGGGRGGFRGGPGGGGPGGGWRLLQTTTTGADGRYSLDGVQPDQPLAVLARHPSYAQAEVRDIRVEPGGVRAPVNLTLTEGGTLVGRVIDEEERPIADAEVRHARQPEDGPQWGRGGGGVMGVFFRGNEQGENIEHTDAQGRFRFEHLLPGDYTVVAQAEGYTYQASEDVVILDGVESEEVTLRLSPGVAIAGRVVDTEGTPLAEAQVTCVAMDRSRPAFRQVVTSEAGSFEITGLDERSHTLSASAMGFDQTSLDVTAPTASVELVLERAGVLVGRVIEEYTGDPVVAFEVSARRQGRRGGGPGGGPGGGFGGGAAPIEREFNDPEGRFEIEGVVAGEWSMTVTSPGYATAMAGNIEVSNATRTEEVVITMVRGGILRGQVVTATQPPEPIAGALVSERGSRAQPFFGGGGFRPPGRGQAPQHLTDEEGRFTMLDLSPGEHTIEATAPGYLEATARAVIPSGGEAEELTLVLRQGGTVVGRVVSSRDRTPLPGARVAFPDEGFLEDLADDLVNRGATTNTEGRFEMLGAPAGNTRLIVTHGDFARLETSNILIREGEVTDVGDLRISTGGRIIGWVIDAEGEFLPGAGIFLEGPNGFDAATTDETGEFMFDRLAPGQYVATMSEAGGFRGGRGGGDRSGARLSQTVTIREDEETEVVFVREPGFTVSGRVTDEGEPVGNIQVDLTSDSADDPVSESGSAVTDDSGDYSISDMSPGTYQVSATQRARRRGNIPLRTDSLTIESADVTFNIELPRSTISGTVRNTEGEPIDGARITALRDTEVESFLSSGRGGDASARTNSSGQYTVDRVQEGDLTLLVRREQDNYGYATRDLTVGFGEEVTGIDFTLSEAARVVGRAYARANGQPMPTLFAIVTDAGGRDVLRENISVNPEGMYALDGLSDGWHEITAFATGFAPILADTVSIPGPGDTEHDLVFDEGGTLVVTVETHEGEPIAQARVELLTTSGEELPQPRNANEAEHFTDNLGVARLEHQPIGSFTLRVAHSGHREDRRLITIGNGRTETETVRLDPVE